MGVVIWGVVFGHGVVVLDVVLVKGVVTCFQMQK
jgi:hypothetical protein